MTGKRILVVTQHFYPENFRINDIVSGFVEDGYEVDVLCGLPNYPEGEWFPGYTEKGPFEETFEKANVFRAKEIPRKGNTSIRIFLNYVSWPIRAFFRVSSLPGRYDSVFCYNTSPVLMIIPAIRASKKFKAPLVVYVLDIWPENLYTVLPISSKWLKNIASRISDMLYSKADRLIAMSVSLQQRLFDRVGSKCRSVHVVPQHAEDFYTLLKRDSELHERFDGKTNLVFAGNFSPAQGLDCLIKAIGKAHRNGFDDLHLLMVGDGMSRASLEQVVKEEGLTGHVTFYGRVEAHDIPQFSELADAMVVSLAENKDLELTIPAKVASCMAAGRPIIACLDGEGATAVRQAECGYVSPAGDIDSLANNLMRFRDASGNELAMFGANARRYFDARFSRKKVISDLETLLFEER